MPCFAEVELSLARVQSLCASCFALGVDAMHKRGRKTKTKHSCSDEHFANSRLSLQQKALGTLS